MSPGDHVMVHASIWPKPILGVVVSLHSDRWLDVFVFRESGPHMIRACADQEKSPEWFVVPIVWHEAK